jgi:hypothetical protein
VGIGAAFQKAAVQGGVLGAVVLKLRALLMALVANPYIITVTIAVMAAAGVKKLYEKAPEAAPYALAGEAFGAMTEKQKKDIEESAQAFEKYKKAKEEATAPKPDLTAEKIAEETEKALKEGQRRMGDLAKDIGGKAGKELEEDLFGEYLKVREQQRQADIQQAQDSVELVKATNEKKRAEMEKDLAAGLLDGKSYYDALKQMQEEETRVGLALIEKKRQAQVEAYKDALADIERQDISPQMKAYRQQEEAIKHRMAMTQLDTEATRVRFEAETKITQELEKQVEVRRQYQEKFDEMRIETAQLLGQITEQEAQLQKLYLDWQKAKQEAFQAGVLTPGSPTYIPGYEELLGRNLEVKKAQALYGNYASAITQGISDLVDALMEGGQDLKRAAHNVFKNIFSEAMKPGLEQLKNLLVQGFKEMFGTAGSAIASAVMGVIGLIGMFLTSGGGEATWTSTGVSTGVNYNRALRGVIAGETTIPIAEIGESLQDALVPTNSILSRIEANTRGLGFLQLNVNIAGLEEALRETLEEYFARVLMTGAPA